MSEHEAASITNVLSKVEELVGKSNKTFKAAQLVLLTVVAGVLLVARFEYRQYDHEKRIAISEQDTRELRVTTYNIVSDVAGIKGRLGITRVEIPKRALQAWKGDDTGD